MKRFDILLVIITVCLIIVFAYLIAKYAVDGNLQDLNAITGDQRTIAIQSTLDYDKLSYGNMIDNNTFQDYKGVNYSFGKIVHPAPDYYCYNASEQLAIVPVKNLCETATTYYYTVNLDKNETVTVFEDDENELTYKEKMEAIKIALNDTYVKESLQEKDPYYIVSVHSLSVFDAGYVNYSGKMARVDISGHRMVLSVGGSATQSPTHVSIVPGISFKVIVDFQNNRELDIFQYFPIPIDMEPVIPETAIIPSGTYRYRAIPVYGGGGTYYEYNGSLYYQFKTGVRFEPADAKIFAAIVNGSGLDKLKNSTDYEPFLFVDKTTNKTQQYDFNSPIQSGWAASAKTQWKIGEMQGSMYGLNYVTPQFYLVLKNNDTRDVRIEYVDQTIESNPFMEYSIPDVSYDHIIRNYTHNASKKVTIKIYQCAQDRIDVQNTDSNKINVSEDIIYDRSSNSSVISDYVRFIGDENDLTIYIDLSRRSEEEYTDKKAYAKLEIDLPQKTGYQIKNINNVTEFPE